MGRSKKTTDDLPDNWQKDVLDIYESGGCDVEVRALLGGIGNELFYRLLEENSLFQKTIKKGQTFAEAWWRKQGRVYIGAGKINTGLYALQMRNRYGWRDANRPEGDVGNISDKLKEIASSLDKLDGEATPVQSG